MPFATSARNVRPSTGCSASAGGRPPAGRIERTFAALTVSPARTSSMTYSDRRNRNPRVRAGSDRWWRRRARAMPSRTRDQGGQLRRFQRERGVRAATGACEGTCFSIRGRPARPRRPAAPCPACGRTGRSARPARRRAGRPAQVALRRRRRIGAVHPSTSRSLPAARAVVRRRRSRPRRHAGGDDQWLAGARHRLGPAAGRRLRGGDLVGRCVQLLQQIDGGRVERAGEDDQAQLAGALEEVVPVPRRVGLV